MGDGQYRVGHPYPWLLPPSLWCLLFKTKLFTYLRVYVCMYVGAHMCTHTPAYRGQRTACWSRLSLTVWVPGTKLRPPDLSKSTFTCWAILLVPLLYLLGHPWYLAQHILQSAFLFSSCLLPTWMEDAATVLREEHKQIALSFQKVMALRVSCFCSSICRELAPPLPAWSQTL